MTIKRDNVLSKTIRIEVKDAFKIEQAVRELAAEMQQEVRVSNLMTELVKDVPSAKERVKESIIAARKKAKS